MNEMTFYYWLIVCWTLLALVTWLALYFIKAPYGKFAAAGWGPLLNAKASWIVMESCSVWLMLFLFFIGDRRDNPVAIVFLVLWEIHYVQRTYIFPFRLRGQKKNFALLTAALGCFFNTVNCYLNGRYLFSLAPAYDVGWFFDPRFVVGVLIFALGMGINLHSDAVLRNLRKPGETGYKIPEGGFFRYVSAANYFGEIVEWTGFAIATWSLSGLVFVIWTAANLIPRAQAHRKWYIETFPSYPRTRKAVIPFAL